MELIYFILCSLHYLKFNYSRLHLHADLQLGQLCDNRLVHGHQVPDGPDGVERPLRLVSAQQGYNRELLVRITIQGYVSGNFSFSIKRSM